MMRVLPSLLAVEAMRRGAEPREAAREVILMATVQYSIVFTYKRKSEGNGREIIKTLGRVLLVKTNFCLQPLSTLKFFMSNTCKKARELNEKLTKTVG